MRTALYNTQKQMCYGKTTLKANVSEGDSLALSGTLH